MLGSTRARRCCSAAPALLALVWLAVAGAADAQTITATVGTSVADADENGAGDNVSNPAGVPGLGAAGVNAAGGPGSNGTLRFHIEWNLTGLTGPVSVAQVLLTTRPSGFSAVTEFYVATGDGNGTIENTDFETAATQIPGVLLPTNNDGTFTFDVTAQVNAALANNFTFLVIQGRVQNEAALAAGAVFNRGAQIRTTCPPTTCRSAEDLPLLLIGPAVVPALGPVTFGALLALLAAAGFFTLRRTRAHGRTPSGRVGSARGSSTADVPIPLSPRTPITTSCSSS